MFARVDRVGRTELRRTVDISIREGVFAQMHMSLAGPGSVFLTKLAAMLGASALQFSFLAAIAQASQLFQPLGVAVTRRLTSRRKAVLALAGAGRALVPLYGVLPLLLSRQPALTAFLCLYFVSTSVQAVAGNAWIGWIGDMVPLRIRGRFFARRNQVLMVAGLVVAYLFAVVVDLSDQKAVGLARLIVDLARIHPGPGAMPLAFLTLFVVAGSVGIVALAILARQPERPKRMETDSFSGLLRMPFGDRNFRRLLIYGVWWMLTVGIGGPFWQPFMLQKLHMSVVQVQVYGTLAAASALLSLRFWGRLIDRFGNKNAMRIAIVLGSINPLIWVFATRDTAWILYLEGVSAGAMWAGAGIVATSFVLAIAPSERRQIYSGLFGAASGLGMMLTILLSGVFLPPSVRALGLSLQPEQVLFLVGGLARLTSQIPLSWVEEPAEVPMRFVLRRVQQYAKVRIVTLPAVMVRTAGGMRRIGSKTTRQQSRPTSAG